MFKNILVPTDGSPLSDIAVNAAIEFAQAMSGSKLVALSVAEPYPFSPLTESSIAADSGIYEEKMREVAEQRVQKVADAARQVQIPCETVVAQSFSPYEEIIATANKFGCDVIFMSSHGRKGLNRFFVGSETQKVLAHTTIPVLVFR
ncbi:universal stress protein [Undibacterium arcticum]|jgi:nucleotide-binding universal stress UspA family protein|uniref:Universal stress protein n=1 Tax=Undibacterium arcticum TaxID=1762892 RepID=A0ABV7F8Y1_9BURK